MDIDRSTVLVGILLATGVALVALPIAVPADVPDNRVEFYVEANWSDYSGQTNLVYATLNESARGVFDEARRATPETINRSIATAPESVTPPPDSIELYNVQYEGAFYLLQGRHLTSEADFLTQQAPRFGSMAVGFLLVVGAAYWRFEV
ncbi:hypothetical protein [Halorhabdus sp. BNX81]|uniref:hypothetical protein n=1 Tax=Halorhabdus sp. BNX81 TaxID=2980181 RepID=UPI0023DCF5A9|nr:hypothetical protein [Halorhabdus sp. BNX81]WEL21245.1 hypothetical protein HBNXHr_1179 [Halorhabdus sp. BNX81]